MEIKKGIPVSLGYAIAEAYLLDSEDLLIPKRLVEGEGVGRELKRFERAVKSAHQEIEDLCRKITGKFGEGQRAIFEGHLKMVEDESFLETIRRNIRDHHHSAEYAVSRACRPLIEFFNNLEDAYFKQRVIDIYDIERRLLRNLLGEKREELKNLTQDVVIVAKDLTPSQAVGLDETRVVGFATDAGGASSHTAIIAKSLGIPAVVGLGSLATEVSGGDVVVLDGNKGIVIVNPDEGTIAEYERKRKRFREFSKGLAKLRELPAETLDGLRVRVLANIEFPGEVESALAFGAEGIGLYRTEFLYLEMDRSPTEKEHFDAYRQSVERLKGRPLVIRTLDLGGDKLLGELGLGRERNPALGYRSIRYCLDHLETFKPQLRAILRASAFGPVKILLPMISSVEEIQQFKGVLAETREELDREGAPYDRKIQVGVMIEVPVAAIAADLLAREAAFFSIGTNDLIQYSIAVDRGNERVAQLYAPAHPGILRLLRLILETGRKEGLPVSMCGEMSGDVLFTIFLVGIGLKEFSVAPSVIPEVKKVIRSIRYQDACRTAETVMGMSSGEEISAYLREKTQALLPEAFS